MANTFNSIRYWNTQENFTYPELDPTPGSPYAYSPIINRPNSGICVSGGGSVSASLIAGYYAALAELGIMKNLRYISGVSGGTWGSAPYVYQPAGQNFSGTVNMPDAITVPDIETTTDKSMQRAAVNADIADKCLTYLAEADAEKTPTNRVYEKAVGSIFLNSFDIPSPAANSKDAQFFSSTSGMVNDITTRNAGLNNGFMTMADDMPFLIMNATMLVPVLKGENDNNNNNEHPVDNAFYICPFEITPLYCGIKAPQTTGNGLAIGGFFVETFGFNTTLTGANNNIAQATGDYPFELCQPVGASGSALETMLENSYPKLLGCFPQFNYWNPFNVAQGTQQYDFGDGGIVEDTGITPLLARGVQNIAAFLTEPVFFPATDSVSMDGFKERAFGYNQIASLFGQKTINGDASAKAGSLVWKDADLTRQVFDSSQFSTLLGNLSDARNGNGAMVVKMTMTVLQNNLFGITPVDNYQPTVIWSVVDKSNDWIKELKPDVKAWMALMPELKDFPEVEVFGQNIGSVIKLTPGETNQLANFGYWMVKQNQDLFQSVLAPASVTAETEMA